LDGAALAEGAAEGTAVAVGAAETAADAAELGVA
jgi:hypothetical protein